jgi:hypothetical protein
MTSTNHFRMSMRALPHTHSCFVCGERNVHGLQLRFETDGTLVKTKFTPGEEHIGFQNVTHGGILATVLDEIMVWACAVATRRFAYCAGCPFDFKNPPYRISSMRWLREWMRIEKGASSSQVVK